MLVLSPHCLVRKWRSVEEPPPRGSVDTNLLTAFPTPPCLVSSVTKICAQCEMEHSADGLMEQMCSSDFGELRPSGHSLMPPQPLSLDPHPAP